MYKTSERDFTRGAEVDEPQVTSRLLIKCECRGNSNLEKLPIKLPFIPLLAGSIFSLD